MGTRAPVAPQPGARGARLWPSTGSAGDGPRGARRGTGEAEGAGAAPRGGREATRGPHTPRVIHCAGPAERLLRGAEAETHAWHRRPRALLSLTVRFQG